MIPSAEDLYGDADFFSPQDLTLAHTATSTKTCFDAHALTVLDWPAKSPHLNPTYQVQTEGHQTQKQRRAGSNHQGNLGLHNSQAMPQAECSNDMVHQESETF